MRVGRVDNSNYYYLWIIKLQFRVNRSFVDAANTRLAIIAVKIFYNLTTLKIQLLLLKLDYVITRTIRVVCDRQSRPENSSRHPFYNGMNYYNNMSL